ncbi:Proteasome regulatory subunit [Entamoeba marina]
MTEALHHTYIQKVIVHPLVMLSVADHQKRAAKEGKRVVGVLLGYIRKGVVDVMNSLRMTQRVTAKELLVGWYSTSPEIKNCDIQIHSVVDRYTSHPIYLTMDVTNNVSHDLPVHAYVSAESVGDSQNILLRPELSLRFVHVPTNVGSDESEVGVERLLKDLQKPTGTILKHEVGLKVDSLKALDEKITLMREYLFLVEEGKIPVNNTIIQNIQDIFNLTPDIEKYTQQFAVNSNDVMATVYLASLLKSVISLHELIRNRNDFEFKLRQEAEKKKADKEEELAESKKENDEKEKEDKSN